jgi:hypothetical protein
LNELGGRPPWYCGKRGVVQTVRFILSLVFVQPPKNYYRLMHQGQSSSFSRLEAAHEKRNKDTDNFVTVGV